MILMNIDISCQECDTHSTFQRRSLLVVRDSCNGHVIMTYIWGETSLVDTSIVLTRDISCCLFCFNFDCYVHVMKEILLCWLYFITFVCCSFFCSVSRSKFTNEYCIHFCFTAKYSRGTCLSSQIVLISCHVRTYVCIYLIYYYYIFT